MSSDHQYLAGAIEDQPAYSGNRRMCFFKILEVRFEFQTVLLEDLAQLAQVLDDEIGVSRSQLRQGVVAGKHGAGMDAAMAGSLDIMLHVSYEYGFRRIQLVLFKNIVDFFPLVPNPQVRFIEVFIKPNRGSLDCKMVLMDGAEQKRPQIVSAAKLKELPGMRQFANGTLYLLEAAVEPILKLRQRNMRQVPVVKDRKRQAKLGAELFETHLRALRLS